MAQPQPQDAFSAFFASPTHYGDRWHTTLYPALLKQQNKAIFYNRYTPLEDFNRLTGGGPANYPSSKIERLPFPSAPNDIQADNLLCYLPKDQIPPPEPASAGLRPYAYIPTPLALAVYLLQVLPGDKVLEHGSSGAAPALAQSLWPHLQASSSPTPPLAGAKKACLHANWVDTGDSGSVAAGFRELLPASLGPTGTGEAQVLAPARLGTGDEHLIPKPPLGGGGYDKCFVKASTLSEAVIMERRQGLAASGGDDDDDDDATWPPEGWEVIFKAQVELLMAAMGTVRFGGRVMWVTGSVAREENDGVVDQAIEVVKEAARQGAVNWTMEVEGFGEGVERELEEGWAERTERGWIVLPDHKGGRGEGPLWFCMLTKNRV